MLRSERKTINSIKKHFGYELVYLDVENNLFISNEIKIPYKYKDMPYIIRSLSDQGYIMLSNHPTDIYFSLTYEGYNRFKFMMDSFKTSFFTKWIPGFISGVVTAIATELLLNYSLLSYIQEILQK